MRRMPLSLIPLLLAGAVHADEGMWQPAQVPELADRLTARGLALEPAALADLTGHPLGAVIGFGFCTASFVSPEGLIVTNHHCAYGAIQYNSTAERNLLTEGFLARTPAEELPAEPTLRVYVTESIEDVTGRVTEGLASDLGGRERYDAIDAASKAIVAECEATPGYRCDVYVFHHGLSFQLVRQFEIRDVRLVYAPKEAIGKFGGDIDNWMWPRHTGDYTFYRAYVAPDGSPADHDEANVPYRPRHHLRVQPKGVQPDDFVMVAGYPGRTNRYRLADEVRAAIDWQYPTTIELFQRYIEIVEGHDDAEGRLKYAGNLASWNNTLKNFGGQIEGLRRVGAVGLKSGIEDELAQWLARSGARGDEQQAAIAALRADLAAQQAVRERDLLIRGQLGNLGLFRAARDLFRLSIERERDDAQRESGYQQRDEARIEGGLRQLDRRFDPVIEVELATEILGRYLRLDADQRIAELDAWLDGASTPEAIRTRLQALYRDTRLGELDQRLHWFQADRAAIEAADDPYLKLIVALMPAWLRLEDERKEHDGRSLQYRPQYMQAMIDFQRSRGQAVYPDANNSLRITYGSVTGYLPRDGVLYTPLTTLEGLLAKHTGEDPFDATQAQVQAIRERRHGSYADAALGSVPVNFLSDLDVTGGNSGSPTLNAKGELVGLLFDGNLEAVSASWIYEPAITRSIHVDVRYMLWVMEMLDEAGHLLREMGLTPNGDD